MQLTEKVPHLRKIVSLTAFSSVDLQSEEVVSHFGKRFARNNTYKSSRKEFLSTGKKLQLKMFSQFIKNAHFKTKFVGINGQIARGMKG